MSTAKPGQYHLPLIAIYLIAATLFLTSCTNPVDTPAANAAVKDDLSKIHAAMRKIEPFFRPMGKPEGYDWLGSHNEPGQTFDEYVSPAIRPNRRSSVTRSTSSRSARLLHNRRRSSISRPVISKCSTACQ